jgi:hypothetical protein
MSQATEGDTIADDNVTPIRPDLAQEPSRQKTRQKDPRAAARQAKKRSRIKGDRDARPANVTPPAPPLVPAVTPPEEQGVTQSAPSEGVTLPARAAPHHGALAGVHASPKGGGIDMAAYTAAVALASAAAFFSIKGMVVIFPGSPMSVVGMAVTMEGAKLITAGWLARRWSATAVVWRLALIAFVIGLAVINAAGVYAQLVSAHVGERGAAQSDLEAKDAALGAKLESQIHIVADLDRRLGQIEAAKRGRTNAALSVIEGQRKARAALVDERNREAGALAALKAERASVAAKGRQIETEAAPIRYVAELVGVTTDSERAIRWLIALMVLCCDPLAIALTAAASARR